MTDRLLAAAISAARTPAAELVKGFRNQMQVDFKRDRHDPVTVYDKRAEEMIREHIFREVPESTFMGEEGGSTGNGPVTWYVDPIDGTANFAAGIAIWCTSVGAVVDRKVVAGAIYDPMSDTMFSASSEGAWINGKPMQPGKALPEENAVFLCGYPTARDFKLDGRETALNRLGQIVETVATLRRPGSAALNLCHVAAGWSDGAAGFNVNPWDVTAGALIVEKAGGRYVPLSLGLCDDDAPAHLQPGYLALRAGANYPVLEGLCAEISQGRRKV